MNVYVMRHGETSWNTDKRIQGSSDIELNENGIRLAGLTSEGIYRDGIRFDSIYTSPYKRAQKTADIIAARQGVCVIPDARIREICFGKYEGEHLRELIKTDKNLCYCFTKPSLYVPDETAESFEAFFERIRDFTDNELVPLEGSHKAENVLVVCHGAVIRAIMSIAKGLALDDFWDSTSQENCSLNLFEIRDGELSLIWEKKTYYQA